MIIPLNFTKMHGIGNDFIVINNLNDKLPEGKLSEIAKILCDRHYSIGADGIIIINKSDSYDLKMRIFNPDGSEAEMCGNGVRCFAKYVYENKIVNSLQFQVETLAGVIIPKIMLKNSKVEKVEVDMGPPKLKRSEIPMNGNPDDTVISEPHKFNGLEYKITCVNMGNPHCVIYVDNIDEFDMNIGRIIEQSIALFPNKINVEFVKILSKNHQKVRVWERGAGITLACGTGACATVVSSILNKKFEKDKEILVSLPGGDLNVKWASDDHLYLKGPAKTVFQGKMNVEI